MTQKKQATPPSVDPLRRRRLGLMLGVIALLSVAMFVVYSGGDSESGWNKSESISSGGEGLSDMELVRRARLNIIIRHKGDVTQLTDEERSIIGFITLLSETVTPQAITRLSLGGDGAPENLNRLSEALGAFNATQCKAVVDQHIIPLTDSLNKVMVLPPSASKLDTMFIENWEAESVAATVAQAVRANPEFCR
jgi:hypothetical protein